jgi:hypothetical protein
MVMHGSLGQIQDETRRAPVSQLRVSIRSTHPADSCIEFIAELIFLITLTHSGKGCGRFRLGNLGYDPPAI